MALIVGIQVISEEMTAIPQSPLSPIVHGSFGSCHRLLSLIFSQCSHNVEDEFSCSCGCVYGGIEAEEGDVVLLEIGEYVGYVFD